MTEHEAYPLECELDHVDMFTTFGSMVGPGSNSDPGVSHEFREPDLDSKSPVGAPATAREVYSYYCYYAGNNGIGSFQYSNLLFQNLTQQAGFNPNILPLGSVSCDVDTTAPCHVWWGGGNKHKSYTSVVLIASGLTFLSQALVFIGVGSLADFGNWNPWVVRVFSLLTWAFELGFLGVHTASKWRTAMALYMISGVTFWASYIFFNAIFPKIAHDLPEVRGAREELLNGKITEDQFERTCSMSRSKIMNMSYFWNNIGFTVCTALTLATLFGIGADDSTAKNNWGYSVSVAVCTGFWIILAVPWFILEQKRPGPKLPAGDNYLTFGFKQTWFTVKQLWKLKQTFFYFVAFFLLADGLSTTLTLISIAQTHVLKYSAISNTYLIMVQGGSAGTGVFAAYHIQRYFKLRTKTVLQITNAGCVIASGWGMIGIWSDRLGYHNAWEFWAFNATYGFTLGPQFSYGQAFMAELVPRGREYMFFSLLGIVSKGSAWIGPIVSSAIVDVHGNQWTAFPWATSLILVPFVGIFFIDEVTSRKECAEYLTREAADLRKVNEKVAGKHATI
ncbi:uncharacterized protein L3040_000822 [Drepanopeziza brunnea f. sp. 'multigermtubi']|uniref:uncharacterized protein n=1 Tax=Drepanopeziza brunnea f. sp. 'multigermtubi' TaxID=698441 RepID=UPI002396D402|nr:hypothetical protein L3040_000822 [Drepanopeziza brunnea f. sp. 'multigermtubi']